MLDNFEKEGYLLLDFNETAYLTSFRELIQQYLKDITNNPDITLETFHQYITNDDEKIDIQYKINSYVWKEQLHENIIKENISLYHQLIGQDLDLQVKPYIRIARPNAPQDNIGFHRDSFYGNSGYEVSSFVALVDLDDHSALQIEPKSHHRGPIPTKQVENKDVSKGDIKNQLGFLYSPKIIDENYEMNNIPIPMKFGQVLLIGLGTIHGQEVNSSDTTRWSIDIRVKNTFASSNTKDEYYKHLSSSPMSRYAKIFYENNSSED
jgi:sporadic carbohydrate cluster 2OG-Fe(II) oxygenase